MVLYNLKLKNWRNFKEVNVPLKERTFLVGPNASGKSNFLDALRFFHDLTQSGGGLQKAISDRGGISKIRCLSARREPIVELSCEFSEDFESNNALWKYEIAIRQETRGRRLPLLVFERVYKDGELILDRPDKTDENDDLLLSQTHLEQLNANAKFRDISNFFKQVQYLHVVPQLLRHPEFFPGPGIPGDPFGQLFLEKLASTPERIRKPRLKKLNEALRIAVPQLRELTYAKDEKGVPHLEALYSHWRAKAGLQREDQFSDGTLRLIGLLWSLLDGDSLLLLEEPELSLHASIVKQLAPLIFRIQSPKKRQILISTHSADLLNDPGISSDEVLVLYPSKEGTSIKTAANIGSVNDLLKTGFSISEAIMPITNPKNISQLSLFKND